MEAALPATNSASMPKRCLILLSTSFLSSALLGTETTTFPSRLAVSTILFHSFCGGCPICACATLLPNSEQAMKTRRNTDFMRDSESFIPPKVSVPPQRQALLPYKSCLPIGFLVCETVPRSEEHLSRR